MKTKQYHLEWKPLAEQDRTQIIDYLAEESPLAALAQGDEIEQQVERLVKHPGLGRPGRVRGTRELVINRTPYIAAYRVTANTITILRVLHGAQRWPKRF
jgi:toxin ParE1/3/4